MNGKNGGDADGNDDTTLDSLWDLYDKLCDEGLDDKSEEGQNLRTSIKEFIEDNDLDVSITRKKTNEMLLNEIQDILDEDNEEEAAPKQSVKKDEPVDEPADDEEEEENDAPAAAPSEPEDEEQTPTRASHRRERNDDTNEPAVEAPARTERRAARPHRRR